jgi:uncharacterized protein
MMDFDGFNWDPGNRDKCCKHGVSVTEIESLFRGTPLVGPDPKHSEMERRFRAIGRTTEGRSIFVVFTMAAQTQGAADPSDQRPLRAPEGGRSP